MLNNRIIKFILKLLVSLAFMAWLVFKVDWTEVLVYAGKMAWWQIALYLAVVIAGMFISAYKWQLLAKNKEMKFSLKELLVLYLTGSFINNFMPSTIGGDTYRAYGIGKATGQYAKAASTVVMDRITGLLGLMLMTLFFALLNWRETFSHPILYLLVTAIAGALLVLLLLEKGAKSAAGRKLSGKLPIKVKEFIKTLHEYYLDRKLFSQAMSLSAVFGLVGVALANYVLFWSLGIRVEMLDYLSVIFLISIISAAPVSVNNIGIKEWAYVTLFGFFGVNVSAVVAVALISRLLQMFLSFCALPAYLKSRDALRK